jgi:hypothetical protein
VVDRLLPDLERAGMSGTTGGGANLGRADLHIHTMASDGVSPVAEILEHAERAALDVIAITDHERLDAALAARSMAEARGSRVAVIVGEEVTTRGGHVIGLFLTERIKPWGSLRSTVAQIHEQGGLAVIAHPLVPYPLCVSARSIRSLISEHDPIFHPDAIEAFNPTTARLPGATRVPAFAEEVGLPVIGASDAHRAEDVGHALTTFPGKTPEDLRAALAAKATRWEGTPHTWRRQFDMFVRQQRKNANAVSANTRRRVFGIGLGRDLGYPRESRP